LAKVVETADQLQLQLSILEKFLSLHGDITIAKSALLSKKSVANPWRRSVIKGIRAPGAALPYLVLLGTMRYRGGKDFTAKYKKKSVEVFEFIKAPYKRWIITK
jgi:hypothetical protein